LALGRIVGDDVDHLTDVLSQITEFDFDAM
jgi:hypothetical protein